MPTTAEIIVETLIDWGVDTIFGLPGDGVNGVMEAIRKQSEKGKLQFIQVRHEESAAFAACGYSKFTGRLGVCLATSGPGGIHLLNGLYDAKMDGAPVLAITGLQFHDLLGTHTQQDVPLDRIFADVAVYNERIMGAAHARNVTELAVRTALARRGVSHITIPVDVQDQKVKDDERSDRNLPNHVSHVWAEGARVPGRSDLEHAAQVFNGASKIAILAGQGALTCGDELEELAELLGAPIIKALLGKACVPDDSPYTTGGIGLLGTAASQEAMESCDALLIVGSSFPYIEFYPKPGKAKAVQIDRDAMRIGLRYPIDVGLVGDAKVTLRALKPLLRRKDDRGFLETAQKNMKDWRELMHTRETAPGVPMKPQVIAAEVGRQIPDNAIVIADSGTNTTWWARHIPAKKGQMHSCSGTLASMACAVPYAIGAQVAYPDRPVVVMMGDGGFSMLMAEFATCVKYKLPVKIFIIKNNYLGQIMWEQMVFLGNPEFACDLQPIDFAMVARACGGAGLAVDDPQHCPNVVEEALATPGPVVVEATVDPHTAPLPGKINMKQALHFAESIARGTTDAASIVKEVIQEKIRELV